MSEFKLPSLELASWQPTRDTIAVYGQILGKIRRALTPRQKHWWHISLRAAATGLTTTPIPAGSVTFELLLDFTAHQLVITTSRGERWHKLLEGQSAAAFCEDTLVALASMGIEPNIDRSLFNDTSPGSYDPAAVERFWQVLSWIDAVLKQFKGELRQETSPVQLWPHHFDLSMVWFSGRLVPGVNPADEEHADEQLNFGFSTGDAGIPDPYFFITAYPLPDGMPYVSLPTDATWHSHGFQGAVLRYESLTTAKYPDRKLLHFWRTVQQAGANLMR